MHPEPDPAGPGQESVWRYPRPAICEPTSHHLVVWFGDRVIAETRRGVRTLETSHPPTYYFPPADVDAGVLQATTRRSICEWKGQARYLDVSVGGQRAPAACWSYPSPTPAFVLLANYFAFYPGLMQACFIDGEQAQAQPGDFYGGWVSSHVAGPFKGGPGTAHW